jgi:hypothetical protein
MGSPIGKTMDSLLPPDWGKANYRDKVSGKQVEYYYNRKTHQSCWAPPPPNFSSSENDDDNTDIHHSQGLSFCQFHPQSLLKVVVPCLLPPLESRCKWHHTKKQTPLAIVTMDMHPIPKTIWRLFMT